MKNFLYNLIFGRFYRVIYKPETEMYQAQYSDFHLFWTDLGHEYLTVTMAQQMIDYDIRSRKQARNESVIVHAQPEFYKYR